MARITKKNDYMRPKHLNADGITFSMLTYEEIKKLCVTKIVTPITMDSLGYPIAGGLYDKALGPLTEKSEPCGTCFQNIFQCPGHFGYIELPLPLVNPLFHKIVGTILRLSCLSCFRIQVPNHIKYSLIIQIKLLRCGLLSEANEIASRMKELLIKYETVENIPENEDLCIADYEKLIKKSSGSSHSTRNTEILKSEALAVVLKDIKTRKRCMFCKHPMGKIQALKNKILVSVKADPAQSQNITKGGQMKNLSPEESRTFMRKIWQVEKQLVAEVVPMLTGINCDHPTDVFYLDLVVVTPSNMRPVNIIHDMISESPQTQIYKNIVNYSILCRMILSVIKNNGSMHSLTPEAMAMFNASQGKTPIEKLNYTWESLQYNVDTLLDHEPSRIEKGEGLKQIIEKKSGIIRQNMMGKRVNYAARSVITPDPNLNIDEIGVPEAFAKQLVYAVPVTAWNVKEIRKMIMNGPNIYPGAIMIQYEDGMITKINNNDKTQQESILKRLLTPRDLNKGFKGIKTVYRHLCNGDIMLLNRQPTLHKPSIMAHKARILKGEKTLRLHYANCKAYNADFDGDEMNAHFPQNEVARSEGYLIANVSNQYLVPKDGTPLSGLIQDHIISGAKLSLRGQFFTKCDYQQLVFQGLSHKTSDIILLPPCIIKPVQLWSGKQILSTVIINIIPPGKQAVSLDASSKISAEAWRTGKSRTWKAGGTPFKNAVEMSEAEVIIRKGELLSGVLDKTHYGPTPYGLVHCVYELYGGTYAIKLLSSFAKLFMSFLQKEGFTLGVHDILVQKKADKHRTQIIKESRLIGKNAVAAALNLPEDTPADEIVHKIEQESGTNPKLRATIDRQYKTMLDGYTNSINKTCLPAGLLCKFPHNNLQFMVQSGAKGSTVNTMQISCLLGQIELEGKRPPVMISGKSLPSFPAFEFSPRAGGFIDGRFMTGIQPQEFFFHCMAGREGLIDTAVKTSRSGYLQRCLIKHLEGLSIAYDLTVRDSDKSVIQFYYGEDGMDISKAQFLKKKQFPFLAENAGVIIDSNTIKTLKKSEGYSEMEEYKETLKEWQATHGNPLQHSRRDAFLMFSREIAKRDIQIEKPRKVSSKTGRDRISKYIVNLWREAGDDIKTELKARCDPCPEPVNSRFQSDCYFGSMNERLEGLMDEFLKDEKSKKKRKEFQNMLKLKAMGSLAAPGEPVGLLAAQSIGEPSTQMTLNTFHFAGRGEMNVTLGIPRLREILMEASKRIKTPSMEIPFLSVPHLETKAERLRKTLTRVVVADVLEKVDVTSQLEVTPVRQQVYIVRFQFLPHQLYKTQYNVKPKKILKHMTKTFFGEMFMKIRKTSKINTSMVVTQKDKEKKSKTSKEDDDEPNNVEKEQQPDEMGANKEDDSSDEEVEDAEDAKQTNKYQQAHEDQEAADDEKEMSDEEDTTEKFENETDDEDGEFETTQANVINQYLFAQDYQYDRSEYLWCEISFALPLSIKKVDLSAILKEVVAKSVLWETPSIRRAITYMKNDILTLRTDGINIAEMFRYSDLLDVNKLYSNDIHQIAVTYGIEAATKVIVKEVQDVFSVYGIVVDPRHLLLIADYMTSSGEFLPLNRKGMESSTSPLQQMSFESSLAFLKNAIMQGKHDSLLNPSSSLMLGKPCRMGTGAFDLLQKLPVP